MKSTKLYFKGLIVFLLFHATLIAQYKGGISDGEGVNTLINTTCGIPPGGFAYLGGSGDGNGMHVKLNTTCGLAPGAFAYTGGSGDGQGVHTFMDQICPFPPQFYAFFGGNGDGHSMNQSTSCAIVLPIADFNASPTTVCVNTNVNFTDMSTNTVAWEWDFDGGTVVAPSTIYSQNPIVTFAQAGTYTIVLKAKNSDGEDVETKTSYINVGASATITDTTPGSRCGSGSVTLNASSGGIVRWYNALTGGTLLGTGTSFITPNISISTTYYAEAFNGCTASTRTAVVATVNAVPTITGNPASRCDAGVVTISANPSIGTVSWFNVASGGTAIFVGSIFTTPSISTTTTYYAETTSAQGCTSVRIPVVATVNAMPTITTTTPATRCGLGSVTLQATASVGTTIWYNVPVGGTPLATTNSFVTPSISATTTYYVEASLGSCTSTRTAVVATVNAVPTIVTTIPGNRCDAGSVTLQATASNGTLSWYNTSVGGTALGTGTSFTTPSISTSTNYYVESSDGTCTSARVAVLATVNATPSVTLTIPSQICDSGAVTLGATASAGILNWYQTASGGSILGSGTSFTTPSINTTTTFYVEAVNGSCSSDRVPVVATVHSKPTITSTTGATTCGNTNGTLSATASNGTIYWYTVAVGGTAFATGTSIPVNGSSHTYYVEAISNGCVSDRMPVVYENTPYPVITSVSSSERCGLGSVVLNATSNFGTINWYDASVGGNLINTGTSFTTPILTNTTNYYVEAVNNSCNSVERTQVTAIVNHTASPIATSNQTFCLGETVGLIVATGSSIIWYNSATGGVIVPYDTVIVSGTTYYASQTISGCESEVRTPVTMTMGGCLGMDDFVKKTIKLYPNPVVDVITIKSTDLLSKVEVINMLGQLLFVQSVNDLETTVDMRGYPSGTYNFRVCSDDKVEIFKVIKK